MHCGCAVADSEEAGRSGEDQPARCGQLARLLRAGELTAVWVPDRHHEAMRDLTRARDTAVDGSAVEAPADFGLPAAAGTALCVGKKTWTKTHMGWLASQKFEHPEQRLVFEEMMLAMRQAQERLERLEQAIRAAVPDWSLAEMVTALMAMRGIDLISAATFLAEIGDLSRFPNAARADGISWAGAFGGFDRRQRQTRTHHQGRQSPGSTHAGGVRLELSASAAGRQRQAGEGRGRAASGSRDRLEGAVPPAPALSALSGEANSRPSPSPRSRVSLPASSGRSAREATAARTAAKVRGIPKEDGTSGPTTGSRCRGMVRQSKNIVQRQERSHGRGIPDVICEADRKIDARPQTGTAPDEKRTCVNPRIRVC